ncbi:MAG: hypothetical protein V4508_03550 [Pseudomonadota bacterium]
MARTPGAALAACLLTCACAQAGAEACPPQVRVSFPNFDIAPLVLGTNKIESPPGLLVQWTRNALKLTGCASAVTLMRRPPNRQLAEVALDLLDVLPGFAYSDELNDRLSFPMRDGAIDTALAAIADTSSLYVRAGETGVSWDGKHLTGPNPVVGTSTGGGSSAALARQHGWTLELASTPATDIQKLLAHRIDVILEPDAVLAPYLTGATGAAVRKLAPPAKVSLRYAPVRKGFQQQYPDFTARFWLELCKQSRQAYPNLPACSN